MTIQCASILGDMYHLPDEAVAVFSYQTETDLVMSHASVSAFGVKENWDTDKLLDDFGTNTKSMLQRWYGTHAIMLQNVDRCALIQLPVSQKWMD